jgi:hypothetical protein
MEFAGNIARGGLMTPTNEFVGRSFLSAMNNTTERNDQKQVRVCRYCQSRAGHWQKVEHSIAHWPHVLIVRTEGWVCYSCRQTSYDDDVLRFFDRMANKLRAGDIDGFVSLGGDYFSTSYRPVTKHELRTANA